jgi:hypothetical protein
MLGVVLPRMRDRHNVAGRGDLHVAERMAPCCIGPENFRGAMIIDAPSMFPLFGKADWRAMQKESPGHIRGFQGVDQSGDAPDPPILSHGINQARRAARSSHLL